MAEKVNKIIFKFGSRAVEFDGGGGSSTPGPDSVESEQIKDEGVKKQDLDRSIQEQLDVLDDSNVISEEEIEDMWGEAMRNAGLDLGS